MLPTIQLEITPELFTFRATNVAVPLSTYLYLANASEEAPVIAVGSEVWGVPEAVCVKLFDQTTLILPAIDRAACLARFLTYGIALTQQQMPWYLRMRRPKLLVQGANSLQPFLHGYQKAVLYSAGAEAGVQTITFE